MTMMIADILKERNNEWQWWLQILKEINNEWQYELKEMTNDNDESHSPVLVQGNTLSSTFYNEWQWRGCVFVFVYRERERYDSIVQCSSSSVCWTVYMLSHSTVIFITLIIINNKNIIITTTVCMYHIEIWLY